MSEIEPGSLESLDAHNAWLYPDPSKPCRCTQDYKGFGRMHGMDMGKGWVRVTTHPDCYHHGTKAQTVYRSTGRWPS